jgi:hypothetical protein
MGDLPMDLAKATAVAMVSSLVRGPRMTSTNGILRTGLKKWMPQNRSGCFKPSASKPIEMAEVFDARMASGPNWGSILL